jgi:hypothetical protein
MRSSLVTLVILLIVGCDSRPTSSPVPINVATASPTSADPSPSPEASPAATTAAVEPLLFLRVPFEGNPYDAVWGDTGWVIVGSCDTRQTDCISKESGSYRRFVAAENAPSIAYSADAKTWEALPPPTGRDGVIEHVTWNGEYYAAGYRFDPPPGQPQRVGLDGVFWRSPDGRAWERISVVDLGDRAREIPELGPLAASESGTLVLGWVSRFDGPNGVHSSRDGITWEQVAPTEFGLGTRFGRPSLMDLVATDAGFLLMGKGCDGCPVRAHVSRDGRTWDLAGEIDVPDLRHISLATDGRRTVATLGGYCTPTCRTEVWTSVDGGSWTRDVGAPELGGASVTFAGSAFVLLGFVNDTPLGRSVAWISVDGTSWTEVQPIFRAGAVPGVDAPCGVDFLAGGEDAVVLGGSCGAWRAFLP